jgi:hypothetical protein
MLLQAKNIYIFINMDSREHAYNTGNISSCEAVSKGSDLVLNKEKENAWRKMIWFQ